MIAWPYAAAFCLLSALATWLVARGLGRVREPDEVAPGRAWETATTRAVDYGGFALERQALAGDWKRVGDDLRAVMPRPKKETGT